MLDYISLYPNKYAEEFNEDFIFGKSDTPLEDFIITAMRELEAVENIKIEDIKIVRDQDEVDLNEHLVFINYKKKDLGVIEIPTNKFITNSRYGEIIFKIRISTNLNERVIEKKILLPLQTDDGYYINNDRKMRAIWQLIDASTYSQRGKITLKSRMPIIIYTNKHRRIEDVFGEEHVMPSYSYALNSNSRRRGRTGANKKDTKFINPLLLYSAKMGWKKTRDFFGMKDIVYISDSYKDSEKDIYHIFSLNELFIKVDKHLFEKYELVRSFVCMTKYLDSKTYPVTLSSLEDTMYWLCRIGFIGSGSGKNKSLSTFKEKGLTTLYMVERLLDTISINNLRLPMYYKNNIYYLMYWLITNFDDLKIRSNMDMLNKRIRRNEYIVNSSLGKKINENLNKLIERKGKSKLNTMDTLLELFNFNSDIVFAGMRNLNDLIKTDDLVNDLTILTDLSYSAKGPNKNQEFGIVATL